MAAAAVLSKARPALEMTLYRFPTWQTDASTGSGTGLGWQPNCLVYRSDRDAVTYWDGRSVLIFQILN